MHFLLFLCIFAQLKYVVNVSNHVETVESTLEFQNVVQALNINDFEGAKTNLELVLDKYGDNWNALQLLGSVKLKEGKAVEAAGLLDRSIAALDGAPAPQLCANHLEALRQAFRHDDGLRLARHYLALHPGNSAILENSAIMHEDTRQYEAAGSLYEEGAAVVELGTDAWRRFVTFAFDAYVEGRHMGKAEALVASARQVAPDDSRVIFLQTLLFQHTARYEEGIRFVEAATARGIPDKNMMRLATTCPMLQVLARLNEAARCYEKVLDSTWGDAGVLNNYGSLLILTGRVQEGTVILGRALSLNHAMTQALVNSAGYYQDEGLLDKSEMMLSRALVVDPNSNVRVRRALITSPVVFDWVQMVGERVRMEVMLRALLTDGGPKLRQDSSLDRVPFYPVYHGLNDRSIMELVGAVYRHKLEDVVMVGPGLSPHLEHLQQQETAKTTPRRRLRVAFMSKYFGMYEPHGMLLDGIMEYLPRDVFYVIALPIPGSDQKPLSYNIRDGVDEVHTLSLSKELAMQEVAALNVDMLIFADTLSEPQSHFLAQSRLAPIQIAFWGNPVTSASSQIDYFVSADTMEHPYRTRIQHSHQDPYSEQVVLLAGQGIWYFSPQKSHDRMVRADPEFLKKLRRPQDVHHIITRRTLDIPDDAIVFFCPQSVFKMHPLYDDVLAEIVSLSPSAYVVVTRGRKDRWTAIYHARLQQAVQRRYHALLIQRGGDVHALRQHEEYQGMLNRLVSIPRITAQYFDDLIKGLADVLLHPFPFDGSRTSADGLANGIPILTMPTEFLRGRMGVQFYRTMGIPEMTAHNRSEYVAIAGRILEQPALLRQVKERIVSRQHLIWEDMEVPFEWAKFLSVAGGRPPPSWKTFIAGCEGRDVQQETEWVRQRRAYRADFIEQWGTERYLLDKDGAAALEEYPIVQLTESGEPGVWGAQLTALHGMIPDKHRPSNVTRFEGGMTITDAGGSSTRRVTYRPLPPRAFRDWQPAPMRVQQPASSAPDALLATTNDDPRDGAYGRSGAVIEAWRELIEPDAASLLRTFPEVEAFIADRRFPEAIQALQGMIAAFDDRTVAEITSDRTAQYDLTRALLELGGLLFNSGRHEEAQVVCARANVYTPNLGVSDACAGSAALHAGREDDALMYLHRALRWVIANPSISHKPPCPEGPALPPMDILVRCTARMDVAPGEVVKSVFKAYWVFNRSAEAAEFAMDVLDLPFPGTREHLLRAWATQAAGTASATDAAQATYGGIYALAFAFVDWSPLRIPDIARAEGILIATGRLKLPIGRSLATEIKRLQRDHGPTLDAVIKVMSQYEGGSVLMDASERIVSVIASAEGAADRSSRGPISPSSSSDGGGVILLQGYYEPKHKHVLQNMHAALFKNLANPFIAEVVLICENELQEGHFDGLGFINTHKLKILPLGRRVLFSDVFALANDNFVGRTVIAANSDIYFDESLARLEAASAAAAAAAAAGGGGGEDGKSLQGTVLALLRWGDKGSYISLALRSDSQDAWVFQPPLNETLTRKETTGFFFGAPRCDNVLAHRLIAAGHRVINPSFAIRAIEVATATGGTSEGSAQGASFLYEQATAVEGEGQEVLISDRFVF